MYLLTSLVLAGFALFESFSRRRDAYLILWFISFVLLVFHDGFRWETGTDWQPYNMFFEKCIDMIESEYDIGYTLLNQSIRLFTANYSVFLVIFAIIQYAFICESISKYSIAPFLSVFLYYCFSLPVLGMNRQFIALCLGVFAVRYIVSRNLGKFLLCILIGFTFHKSILLILPAYFLAKQFKDKYYILLLVLVIGISLSGIINNLPLNYFALLGEDSADRMDSYATDFLKGNVSVSLLGSVLAILKRSIWIFLLIFFAKYVKEKNEYYVVSFNMYFIALLIYILFNNTILQIIVGRGLIYFNIMEIFIVPFVLTMFKNNLGKVLLFILIVLYGYTNMMKGVNYYPDVFLPYKSIF